MTTERTTLAITGTPVATFTFMNVPSWNTILNLHWRARAAQTKALRAEGRILAQNFKLKHFPLVDCVVERAMIIVKVYPPHEGIMDVYNVSVKAICDGFVDSKLFAEDDWVNIPVTLFMWAAIDPQRVRRTVIEVHDLGKVVVNNHPQILPHGRIRLS